MINFSQQPWYRLAQAQQHMIARRQLRTLGFDCEFVRTQLRARRWQAHGTRVISTMTGELSVLQRCWLGALHAGGPALVGGLTSAALLGLNNWHRDDLTILVPANASLNRLPGIRWVRTRRKLSSFRDGASVLPLARIEPSLLIFGAAQRSANTAVGVLAAAVQQRLTTPRQLAQWIDRLTPLRRTKLLLASVADFAGGADSVGELDVGRMCRRYGLGQPARQVRRCDAAGRWRYRDCEWQLPDGRSLVLEVDGSFHMEAAHWQRDIERERDLADPRRIVIRCTALELRTNPGTVAAALRRLGVPPTR